MKIIRLKSESSAVPCLSVFADTINIHHHSSSPDIHHLCTRKGTNNMIILRKYLVMKPILFKFARESYPYRGVNNGVCIDKQRAHQISAVVI